MILPKLLPRDFVETAEGLIFAVIDPQPENGRWLCWLRYRRDEPAARPAKLDTGAAVESLLARHPEYLYRCRRYDAVVHGIPQDRIVRCHLARERCSALLTSGGSDPIEARLCRLLHCLIARGIPDSALGISGSLLIGAQTPTSDFDLVAYERRVFAKLRCLVAAGLERGEFDALDRNAWHDAWRRRGCPMTFDEYVWHERRKLNKASFEGTKFDLSLAVGADSRDGSVRKLGAKILSAEVIDDTAAYDHFARYPIDHAEVREILVFTHTYVGQAVRGETVEASGMLERGADGACRLVIGSNREAVGQYLRVQRRVG